MKIRTVLPAFALALTFAVSAGPRPAEALVNSFCFEHVHNGLTCMYFVQNRLIAYSNNFGVFWIN